ncbi:histidine phosphatase family protein [Rhodococcus sp. HNM0563]|uniref:histidine phosphatase family protein n=1 Tax=unclassified Rhodococcus (in: high G+C Gram-positive bacteria) TaxID=192944 RepID=UPI00146F36E2|nr:MULTISPECIES: histidine phosphatase family protein [unclassified Rhodococcus (in: high G+C Gram-positive bacteria)]MCK0092602.1 histidine phosphatase family protein [Rhodococcus sp. F64268]NLU64371.1 histidine phosphatase family protein [Rhodococcus sp. HNM0563]
MGEHIYVVTHPEATHHVDGLVGGWYDSALTSRGVIHAHAIATRLRDLIPADSIPALYTSDLTRATETARPLAEVFDVEPVLLPDLREKSYGVAGGRPQAWLDTYFVPPPPAGERLDHDEGIEGAETKLDCVTRVYRAMARITADSKAHRIVVTHGGSLSWVIASWQRLPISACAYVAYRAAPGSITVLEQDDVFHNRTLHTLGDVGHLL